MNRLLKPFLAIGNEVVRRVLKSRFHWMLSGNVVLLEITGRRSGRKYLVPVNYKPAKDGITVMTYRRRLWWRNLLDGGEFPIYFRGRQVTAVPEVETDDLDVIRNGLIERGWIRQSAFRAKAMESVLIRLQFGR